MRSVVSLPAAALLAVALLAPPVAAEGSRPPSNPMPPSAPSGMPEMSPEEKALLARQEAEDLYADAYKDVEKAKAEQLEADSLSALADPKLAEKGRKKVESATKRFRKSTGRFLEATRLAPEYAEAWNMLGFCYRMSGEQQNAFKAYWECLRLKPDYAPAREYLGEAYLMADNPTKAQEQLAWLKEHDPALAANLDRKIQGYLAKHPPASAGAK